MSALNLPLRHRLSSLYRRLGLAADLEDAGARIWDVCDDIFGDRMEWLCLVVPAVGGGGLIHLVEATGGHSVRITRGLSPIPRLLHEMNASRLPRVVPAEKFEAFGGEATLHLDTPRLEKIGLIPLKLSDKPTRGCILIGFGEEENEAAEAERDSRGGFSAAESAAIRRLRIAALRTMPRLCESDARSRHGQLQATFINLLMQFGSHHDSKLVAEKALDFFVSELGFRRALVATIDDDTKKIFGLSERGFNKLIRQVAFSYATDLDLFSIACRVGEPAFYTNDSEDRRIPDFLLETAFDRVLALPMRVENEVVAVALCEFDRAATALHQEQLGLYRHLGDLLGQSLYISSIYSKLRRTAETDPLTGCYNRRALTDFLDQEIPRVKRSNQSLCLLMIDLCDFKRFNDIYSHVVGDRILKSVARMLMDKTRDSDRVVRYGGDEFVVVMPSTNEAEAQVVVRRIEQAVAEQNENAKGPQEVYLLSIGLRCADVETIDTILEDADDEMYRRKAAQNRTKLFNAFTSDKVDEIKKSDSFVAVLLQNLTQRESHFIDHARKVMLYTQAICQYLGVDEAEMERASLAALLHDIGKITLPISLLRKTEPLTPAEKSQLRMHAAAGADFLAGHKYLDDIRDIIQSHHERWDGITKGPHPGYPDGIAGEKIPLIARIIRIAETFDDLTSVRPYRVGVMSRLEALDLLKSEAGHIFDPSLVDVFIQYMEMIGEPLADFSGSSVA